jgi:hypothetical protein
MPHGAVVEPFATYSGFTKLIDDCGLLSGNERAVPVAEIRRKRYLQQKLPTYA